MSSRPPCSATCAASGAPDPEDVLGEVFLQVARDIGGFEGDWAEFRGWVFTIAHHRLIDARRRSARRPVDLMAEPPEPARAPAGDAAEEALARIGDERGARGARALSEDQRAVLLLRVIGDLSLEQVAEALGKRTGRGQAAAATWAGRGAARARQRGGNPMSGRRR